jgi:erythritol/L-threitol dehydrogenase
MSTDLTIPETMRAVVCRGIKDYRQEVLPVPEPKAGEVLIKVARCGLCAGDAKCYQGADMWVSKSSFLSGRPSLRRLVQT